jgi:hypothetical protein
MTLLREAIRLLDESLYVATVCRSAKSTVLLMAFVDQRGRQKAREYSRAETDVRLRDCCTLITAL